MITNGKRFLRFTRNEYRIWKALIPFLFENKHYILKVYTKLHREMNFSPNTLRFE